VTDMQAIATRNRMSTTIAVDDL